MLHDSDGAMLQRLLGLLFLSSLCSAMLVVSNVTNMESSGEDPNTVRYGAAAEDESSESAERPPWAPVARGANLPLPPTWPPNGPPVDNSSKLRMLGSDPGIPLPDMSICEVLLSMPEPVPFQDIPPFCRCAGCTGTAGPKGDRGDQGPPGVPGSPGRRGMTGFPGRPGFTGAPGMKGQKGDLGEKGQLGNSGVPGMKGGRGFKGEKGDRGMDGPPGTQGPQGESGSCPASCDSVQGPPGTQGPPGPAGGRGLPGVPGMKGMKGMGGQKGDLGRPGAPGMGGPKGDQGEQGVCECTDGMDGADGRPGSEGAKGDRGDPGVQGVQGLMGPKGSMGDMGHVGPPGPCSPAVQSGFTALTNQSFPMPNLPVPFPTVLSNHRGHFNPVMGIYMAPVNGTYVFSYHLSVGIKSLKVGLFHNFYPMVKTTEVTDRSTTSQTIVLHLSMGDQVWLQVKDRDTNGMISDSESSSSFSGYLLHPDSCDMPMGRHHSSWSMSMRGFSWDGPANPTSTPPTA